MGLCAADNLLSLSAWQSNLVCFTLLAMHFLHLTLDVPFFGRSFAKPLATPSDFFCWRLTLRIFYPLGPSDFFGRPVGCGWLGFNIFSSEFTLLDLQYTGYFGISVLVDFVVCFDMVFFTVFFGLSTQASLSLLNGDVG